MYSEQAALFLDRDGTLIVDRGYLSDPEGVQLLPGVREFLAKLRHKYDANINIAFRDNNIVHYATFERGVEGITQACGTGACAVYVSYRDFAQKYVLIPPSRERLSVSCVNETVYFAGLVHKVCDCII